MVHAAGNSDHELSGLHFEEAPCEALIMGLLARTEPESAAASVVPTGSHTLPSAAIGPQPLALDLLPYRLRRADGEIEAHERSKS